MSWKRLWFILWIAGYVGILYYSIIHTAWTFIVAMMILSVFSYTVLQLGWYR